MDTNKLDQFNNESFEFNISKFFNIIKRNKRFISIVSLSFSTFIGIYTYTIEPVWRGSFQIIIKSNNESSSLLNSLSASFKDSNFRASNDPKTQALILKSPSVLMPVYDYAKNNLKDRKIEVSKLSYSDWINGYLNIYYEQGSNILSINYEDTDKKNIINVLNKISSQYKDYSRRDRQKGLSREIDYLAKQEKIYLKNSLNSLKEFNKFSIENNLGNIDGFISLGSNRKLEVSELDDLSNMQNDFQINDLNSKKTSSSPGERFRNQFDLLELYETRYTDYSSFLKPNSSILKSLKLKIENLRVALKRPNEILIKYNQLLNEAERDQAILESIQTQLVKAKLDKVKTKYPWEIISEPTIKKGRVSPKRKEMAAITLFLSFVLTTIFSYYKEKKSQILFEEDDIKKIMPFQFLDIFLKFNKEFNVRLIQKYIKNQGNDILKYGVIFVGEFEGYKDVWLDDNLFDKKLFTLVNINDLTLIDKLDKFFIFAKKGKLTKNDVELLCNYDFIYKNKFIGWFLFDRKD